MKKEYKPLLLYVESPCCFTRNSKFVFIWGNQRAKKVVSDSPGLVDFAIGLVMFVLNLPDRQVLFFGEIQITDGLLSILLIKKGWPLVHYFRLLLGDRSLRHRHSEPPV